MGQSKPVADIGDTQGFDWYLLCDRWALVQRYHPPSIASSFPAHQSAISKLTDPLSKSKPKPKSVFIIYLDWQLGHMMAGWLFGVESEF